MVTVHLKVGRERPIRNGHPWIFSQAIARVDGKPIAGDDCVVKDAGGSIIGYGACNPQSSIAVRMWGDVPLTEEELTMRLSRGIAQRNSLCTPATNVCRLINSEGDFLPGLTVDRYGKGLCIQIGTAAMERRRESITEILAQLTNPEFIYERSDGEGREREGLEAHRTDLLGTLTEPFAVQENDIRFVVDPRDGQKTGLFLDQRENRLLLRQYARDAHVADCFAYTGGFSLNALKGGAASVKTIDTSIPALKKAAENRTLNDYSFSDADFIAADAHRYLRETAESFSLMILDPPKFARHGRNVEAAARAYKDINLAGFKKLKPGGVLFTFSCSQAVDHYLFRQIVFGAAADAHCQVQVLHMLTQPGDHPFSLAHREGEYLTGLVLRIAG